MLMYIHEKKEKGKRGGGPSVSRYGKLVSAIRKSENQKIEKKKGLPFILHFTKAESRPKANRPSAISALRILYAYPIKVPYLHTHMSYAQLNNNIG